MASSTLSIISAVLVPAEPGRPTQSSESVPTQGLDEIDTLAAHDATQLARSDQHTFDSGQSNRIEDHIADTGANPPDHQHDEELLVPASSKHPNVYIEPCTDCQHMHPINTARASHPAGKQTENRAKFPPHMQAPADYRNRIHYRMPSLMPTTSLSTSSTPAPANCSPGTVVNKIVQMDLCLRPEDFAVTHNAILDPHLSHEHFEQVKKSAFTPPFNDRTQLTDHVRTTHTLIANIGTQKLRRQLDNNFHCPSCHFLTDDPLKIRTHHTRQHPPQVEAGDPSQGEARDSPQEHTSPEPDSGASPIPSPAIPPPTPSTTKRRKKRKRRSPTPESDANITRTPPTQPDSYHSTPDVQLDPPPPEPQDLDAALSTLRKISIIINPVHKVAICIDCGVAIRASHVRSHAVTQHAFRAPPNDEFNAILASVGCVDEFSAPLDPIPPMAGLKVIPGYQCTIQGCQRITATERTMSDHFKVNHSAHAWRTNSAIRDIQRIYEFRGKQTLVLVDLKQTAPHQRNYDDYLATIAKNVPTANDDLYRVDSDTRTHGTFLAKMRWNKGIEGLNLSQLLQAASAPANDEGHLQLLHASVLDWLQTSCGVLPSLDVTYLRWINTPKGEIVNAPFRAPVTDAYITKCARIWGRFLMMFLRFLDHPNVFPFELILTSEQTRSFTELLRLLKGEIRGSAVNAVQRVSFSYIATPNEHITQDRYSCSLMRFLVIYHLQLDGTFDLPSNIVPNISCLQFCMRATGALEGHNYVLMDDDTTEGLLDYYNRTLKEILSEGHRYPFTTLREEMHLLSALAHSETRMPCLLWNDNHTVLQVDGSPLAISLIRDMVKALLHRADQLLLSLCEGIDMSSYDECLNKHLNPKDPSLWPKDPLRKQSDKYSFLNDENNPFMALQSLLLTKFFDNEDVFHKYHVWTEDGPIFKQAAVATWFSLLDDLHDVAFCLLHITSGGPARGTELETYRLFNTREAPRTLYFASGHLAFITSYNKSRQRTNFPDRFVARPIYPPMQRIILYLAGPLHYVANCWIPAISDKHTPGGAEVFCHFGKPLRSEDFSRILRTYTSQHLHVSMGLRMWRQMMKALMRRIVNVDIDDDGEQEEDALDESFGHTTSTGRSRYGLTWNDLPLLHEDMLTDIFRVSKRYWKWLNDPEGQQDPEEPPDLEEVQDREEPEPNSNPEAPLPEISYTHIHKSMTAALSHLRQAQSERTKTAQATAAHNERIVEMLQSVTEKIDLTHQAVVRTQATPDSHSLIQDVQPLDIAFARTQALRLYLGNSSAAFKSEQQALAMEVISRGFPHALIVMPTGAGKSAIYASPGYVERAGFCLVVIPYRSLFDQAVQDARAKGLPYSTYPSNDMDLFHSRLIFATLEQCAQPDFCTWCIANKNSNLLRGIVIDEAHDIILASDYRPAFKALPRLTDLNVQIALLTGTLSPRSEVTLLEALRMDPLCIRKIRMPTYRPEIQYRITQTSEAAIDDEVLSTAMSCNLENHERGIIFVLTTSCCDKLAQASGFPKYHGQLTDQERKTSMLHWRSGKSQWIIGTLAMAQGIDVRHVRAIINREISWVSSGGQTETLSIVHFAQMSGRAGRDGKPSIHHLMYTTAPSVNIQPSDDHRGLQAMVDFVSLKTCRRRTLALFLDGIDRTCMSMLGAELCDICLLNSNHLQIQQRFYSSPSGSRLKAPPPPEPQTPAEGSRSNSTSRSLAAAALPTPISRHTAVRPLLPTPSSPTPFRDGDPWTTAPPSDDESGQVVTLGNAAHQDSIDQSDASPVRPSQRVRFDLLPLAPPSQCRDPFQRSAPSQRHDVFQQPARLPARVHPRTRTQTVIEEDSSEESDRPTFSSSRLGKTVASAQYQGPRDAGTPHRRNPMPTPSGSASYQASRTQVSTSSRRTVQQPAPSRSAAQQQGPIPLSAHPALGEGLPTTREGKAKQISQWCEMWLFKCSVCNFFSELNRHFAYHCPTGLLKDMQYKSYRQLLRFTVSSFCYGCLVPKEVHREQANPNPKSPFSCLYEDQLRPLLYLIYHHKPIRTVVFQAMGLNPKQFINFNAYAQWLTQQDPHPEALPNILELAVVYMNLKLGNRLPAVTKSGPSSS
ncbi:hypothetical protein F4604DRAFT_1929027 [Suillus subluteus]|nr:hypothetical protein F4604DRAFT_1929027 [Suillus subluteus]